MSFLLEKYCFFLPPELKTRYTSAKLQRRLEKHYGNSIVIQTQKGQGRSNIVFSSSISIAEAIQAASHLKCELKLSEIEAEVEIGPINEDQTLHAAASIIRRQLQSLDISNETYPTPSEISLSYSTQHTPCLLTKFLLWIIDDKSYNGEDMSNRAGQQYAVQTFDQQLYAVAQQVKWSMPDVFHSHIIRLGGFHGLSCFIATVGKLWASAGLSDLLVDSGIYASNTVDQMLVGKQFNRGVRGLTLAYEALMVLLFKAFFNWCRDENRMKTIQPNVWKVFLDCHSSFAVPSTPQSTEDIEEFFNVFEEHILPLFEEFRTHYCRQKIDKARHEILKKITDVTRQGTVLKGLHLNLKRYCRAQNSFLAYIRDDAENGWIQSNMNVTDLWWVGATDWNTGTWIWSYDFSPLNYTKWKKGEPNDYNGTEETVVICIMMVNGMIEIALMNFHSFARTQKVRR
ncbi:unnamed protein product [Mytilus edulis]|uniref:C-type lectin domain-containing protein n=1 Tax=Mytilus edulis TaxID=6550 RepID=A0A8S3VKB1_MYTED|nr:unnamed protein product [Mytilus edulis]